MTKEWIPNLNIGQEYDTGYSDAAVHFDKLGRFADVFGRDMPMHMHSDYCQIHFVKTGRTLFNIDQNMFESNGCALFYTPPATPHAFLTEPDAPGYVVTIHTSILNEFLGRFNSYGNHNGLLFPVVIEEAKANVYDWAKISLLFELLNNEWKDTGAFKDDALEATLHLIFIQLLRFTDHQEPRFQHNRADILSFRRFSHLLEKHFIEEKSIGFYCDELNINENRLNYLCKKVAATSPKKLINGRIILEAKRLLTHTNMNLTEICYTLGYIDPSYFSRFFLKNTQLTPTEFRQLNRSE